MSAYYNEFDKQKAAWLRELIARNVIAPGNVDERSIHDVRADDLRGYTQCHFFAGIGVWSYAMRLAGWADDRPAWTGSCPCPSFSAAGKGEGFNDPRHLWPVWMPLIRESNPPVVLGEQADGAIGHGWLDLVSTDLEAISYAFGAAVLGACSVGSPNRRQRLYFVADTERGSTERQRFNMGVTAGRAQREARQRERLRSEPGASGNTGELGDSGESRLPVRERRDLRRARRGAEGRATQQSSGSSGILADTDGRHSGAEGLQRSGQHGLIAQDRGTPDRDRRSSPLNGFWRDADWIFCRDGKWRPVRPGSFPLAAGSTARVGRLRGYGDAINAEVAAEFIRAYMETRQ